MYHAPLVTVIGSGMGTGLKSLTLSSKEVNLFLSFHLEPKRLEGLEHYCEEPDAEAMQKAELMVGATGNCSA